MKPRRYDILIVGGGPAGLAAALGAAEAGCRSVAVVERKPRWGWPVQCAELVPRLLGQTVPLERDCIVQPVKGLQFHFGGEAIGFLSAPACLLDRTRFEAALAERAAGLGVALWQPALVRAIAGDGALVSQHGQLHELEARVLIAADGPQSLVRRVVSDQPMAFALALQLVLPLARPQDAADIFLSPAYGTGYGWCFPRGTEANVGVALPYEKRSQLRGALEELVARLLRAEQLASAAPLRRTGGLVPAGGPLAHTVVGSFLLAGDAAGQVHPLSGAGLFTACACGRLAGETAARAAAARGCALLGEYETRWRDLYGEYFARGLTARDQLAHASPDAFVEAVRAAWHLPGGNLKDEAR